MNTTVSCLFDSKTWGINFVLLKDSVPRAKFFQTVKFLCLPLYFGECKYWIVTSNHLLFSLFVISFAFKCFPKKNSFYSNPYMIWMTKISAVYTSSSERKSASSERINTVSMSVYSYVFKINLNKTHNTNKKNKHQRNHYTVTLRCDCITI